MFRKLENIEEGAEVEDNSLHNLHSYNYWLQPDICFLNEIGDSYKAPELVSHSLLSSSLLAFTADLGNTYFASDKQNTEYCTVD